MADKKTAFRTIDGTIIRVHLFHPGIRVKVTTVLTSFSAKQVQVELDPETEAGVYSVLEVAGDSYSTDSFRPATERDYLVKVQPYSARTSDYVADFRNKLHSELMHIEEKPMARLLLHFGESLRNCAQPSVAPNVARQLYEQAAALPGTDTRQQLVEHQHISVNGAWMQRQPHLDWHLADFGSSVKFGQQVWSCTERFYPGQIMHQLAEPKYDWGLLVVLVANELDKANLIGLTGGGNGGVVKDLVLARCAKVKHAGLRDLLSQLIKDAGWV
ncbi:hypothetical protein WJX72_003902 [[Myrmecia] bisecta]|uniref:Uncharacterized protein n=1 Tax=[Myrmecia] bisecta TaxID=41462 RepID=A0AAW1PQ76_9CHLO